MKRGFLTLVFVLVFIPHYSIAWEKEPKDFKGYPFGATEMECYKKKGSGAMKDCKSISGILGDRECNMHIEIGHLQPSTKFYFRSDKLISIRIHFNSSNEYAFLKSVFVYKYGLPKSTKHTTLQLGTGATIDNEELKWIGKKITLEIKKYDNGIEEGEILFMNNEEIKRNLKKIYEDVKRAAENL